MPQDAASPTPRTGRAEAKAAPNRRPSGEKCGCSPGEPDASGLVSVPSALTVNSAMLHASNLPSAMRPRSWVPAAVAVEVVGLPAIWSLVAADDPPFGPAAHPACAEQACQDGRSDHERYRSHARDQSRTDHHETDPSGPGQLPEDAPHPFHLALPIRPVGDRTPREVNDKQPPETHLSSSTGRQRLNITRPGHLRCGRSVRELPEPSADQLVEVDAVVGGDQLGCLLADHDCGSVGVAADDVRHHTRIGHAQGFDAVDP